MVAEHIKLRWILLRLEWKAGENSNNALIFNNCFILSREIFVFHSIFDVDVSFFQSTIEIYSKCEHYCLHDVWSCW